MNTIRSAILFLAVSALGASAGVGVLAIAALAWWLALGDVPGACWGWLE